MADVGSAWIAAGASFLVSMASLGTALWTSRRSEQNSRDLETLKSRLSDENDAAKAKRDYEYDARKRLYAELYPLAFQLNEAALGATNRIKNLVRATNGGWLAAGPDNWLTGGDPYYFTAVVYALIAPLATYELMNRKLTLLDLTLDHDLHRQHVIARRAYQAMRSDFDLLDDHYPPVAFGVGGQAYAPPETRPTVMPGEMEQRWLWRQGLYSGQISQAVDALLTTHDTTTRVMSYAEFAKALGAADLRTDDDPGGTAGDIKRALRPLSDLFRDFHPARRPVTWRILLAQAACYRAITAGQSGAVTRKAVAAAAHFAGAADWGDFDWLAGGTKSIPPALAGRIDFAAEQEAAFATADSFVAGALDDFNRRYRPVG